jgi:transcriptional regulator with XRE-family HTH domain
MDMRKLVGRNVRQARLKRGLTQEQFAEISGFSQQYISGLERGHRNPTVVSVYELATALGVNYLELLKPAAEPKRKKR